MNIVLLLSVALLQLDNPFRTPWNYVVACIGLAPFWWVVVRRFDQARAGWRARLKAVYEADRSLSVFLAVFLLLQLISFIRGSVHYLTPLQAPLLLDTVAAFGLVALLRKSTAERRIRQFTILLSSLWLAVGLNVILFNLGVRSSAEMYQFESWPNSRMLRFFGWEIPVVLFPLAAGVNSFGAVIGAGTTSALAHIWANLNGWRRSLGVVAAAVVGLSLLLLVDSRSALVFIPISLGVLVLLRGARRPKVAWSAFPPLLLPFALAAVVLAVPNGLIATFKLGDAPTVRQLSERTEIWKRSLDELAQFKWQHLLGFGHAGDVTSGVAESYQNLRTLARKPSLIGSHNLFLQQVFDMGYLGAGLSLALVFLVTRRLAQFEAASGNAVFTSSLGFLVYISLIGSLERAPTIYGEELFGVFLLASFCLLGASLDEQEREG